MDAKKVIDLFKECSVEKKNVLTQEETEYFWLQTKILGWNARECLEISTVYSAYLERLKAHYKIMKLIEKTDKKLLLHTIQANIKEDDLDSILSHVYDT